jgi:hypothetical protein
MAELGRRGPIMQSTMIFFIPTSRTQTFALLQVLTSRYRFAARRFELL